jgi:hypothetical protein
MPNQPTTRTYEPSIVTVFDRLDAWRHFPGYALERRADIFFSLYLREVIEAELHVELADTIIPEFPLKHAENNQSDKVDYLLCSHDRLRIFLVELKTDLASLRQIQSEYLSRAQTSGLTTLLHDVCAIVKATNYRPKYHHLLRDLSTLGFLTFPPEIEAGLASGQGRKVAALLQKIGVPELSTSAIEIVYIQPQHSNEPNRIDFETFARHVARHPDPLSQRFSESLLRWRTAAGKSEVQHEFAKVGA